MATHFAESLQDKLLRLPCHFSWESLRKENVGRTVEMNVENLHEHIQEAIKGTEVMSYNLMGFYKTQQEHFEEARASFEEALKNSNTEDDKIVSLGCLAWLAWKESSSDSVLEEQVVERIEQVQKILRGRNPQEIPEVMAEEAFAIANSGFTEKGFEKASDCIDKALEERPEDVMYKFTKATILQQFYNKKYKPKTQNEAEAQKIKHLWEELMASLEYDSRYPVLYGRSLVQYALFLNQINRDFGATGKEYAEKAEEVARSHQATAVMRNVAVYYIQSSMLDEAEEILEEILKFKPNGNYKEMSILARCLAKKYRLTSSHDTATFTKAENFFRKAWNSNKKYSIPALDLVRLYQTKYDKTHDVDALVKAEKIFRAIFRDRDRKEILNEALICSRFGEFLKGYGKHLASSYCTPDYQGAPVRSPRIEQALQLIHQYTEDKQDEHLLQAEHIFKQVYNDWEDLEGPEKARFHNEFAAFLDKYSDDLAFCYLTKSLELNPHLGYAYEPLKELAGNKIASPDEREKMKGYRTLEKIAQLEAGQELNLKFILPY